MPLFRRKPVPIGQRGEDLAVKALKRAGYRVLQRNAQLGRHEVDIIAQEGDTVAFIEVKSRRLENAAHRAEDNITPAKQRKLILAARWYLSQKTEIAENYRFDVVTVILPEKGPAEITIYRDAFRER